MATKLIDLTGKRFGRLTVTKRSHVRNGNTHWQCICDCGKVITPVSSSIRENIAGCGCFHRESFGRARRTHGQASNFKPTSEYNVWIQMRARCLNPAHKCYKLYGGRGIKICDRWLDSFENFFADLGVKPAKNYSLDRIDNEGDYKPSNCRWANQATQVQNSARCLRGKCVRQVASGKWLACLVRNKKTYRLGLYTLESEALSAVAKFRQIEEARNYVKIPKKPKGKERYVGR